MRVKVASYTNQPYNTDSMSEFEVSFNELQQALGRCQETIKDKDGNVIGWIFYNNGERAVALISDSIDEYRSRLPDFGEWTIKRTKKKISATTIHKTIDGIEIPIEVWWGLDDQLDQWKLHIIKKVSTNEINKVKPKLDIALQRAFEDK